MVDTSEKQDIVRRPIVSLRRRQALMTFLLGGAILISGIGIGFGSALAYLSGSKEVATTQDDQQPTKVALTIARDVAAKCGLDEPQTGKVKEIMFKRLETLRDIRTKAMEEMMAVHRELAKDMEGVMEPGQFDHWKKHVEEVRKHSRFRHRPWGHGPQRGDREGRGKHDGRSRPYGQGKGYPGGMPDMFKRLDKDNNGELTKDEIEKVRGPFQQFIQKADVNGDDKVDRKEFETQLRRRRPPTMPGRDRKPRDRKNRSPSSAPTPELSML
ncbi:MAG: hypothetical protein ISS69_15985 [Phycisphaerae bacterium]|nr:hypothetical protein [Phycisphaerae bacterium]